MVTRFYKKIQVEPKTRVVVFHLGNQETPISGKNFHIRKIWNWLGKCSFNSCHL